MSDEGTVSIVAQHLGLALRPLQLALETDDGFRALANRLGFNVAAIPPNSGYEALGAAIDGIVQALESDPPDASQLLPALIDVEKALSNGLRAPDGGVDDDFAKRLLELLVVDYLATALPTVYRVFRAVGLITVTAKDASGTRPDYLETRLDYDAIPRFLSSPTEVAKGFFAWGASDFAFWRIADWLMEFLHARGVRAELGQVDPDLVKAYAGEDQIDDDGVTLVAAFMDTILAGVPVEVGFTMSKLVGPDPGFILQPLIPQKLNLDLGGDFELDAETNVASTFGILVSPSTLDFRYPFQPGTTTVPTASIAVSFSPAEPKILIGSADGSRLEIKGAKTTVGIAATSKGLDVSAEAATVGLQAVITAGEGDGFVGQLLAGKTITIPLDVGVRWSMQSGISFSGSGKFEVTLQPNLTLGPVRISTLTIGLSGKPATADTPTTLAVTAGAGIAADIGPVHALLDQIGVELDLQVKSGNLGPFDLGVGFKPPTGVGIAVNGGSVHGGGFIEFDRDAGRYSGALELSAYDIAIKAFGLIETKVPGVDFSFVIVISAEFTPIQLGFGFTLIGVGGLIGINRGVDTTALANLVRAGQSEELLFPKNLIENAPKIIRDLATVFPAQKSHYVFGPLGKLGWGTPALITGEIGIILEIPGPVIVLLGEVKCLLPKPDNALVKLNLSIGGTLDFPNKSFSMDASLHDSSVSGFTVSGQMAMRVLWGEQPNFVFSIGGFHPAYQPPKDFPKLQPMALDLGQHGAATITVSGFFAVTSNTVQVGGDARLHAGGSGITLDASVSVKALFVFSPFSFQANIDASVKASFHGHGPSVHLSGLLEGPSPWHIRGEVCVSILFWDACLGFDETFGGGQQPSVPELDPWDPTTSGDDTLIGLKQALEEAGNWSGVAPAGVNSVVSRAQGSEALVDPLGGLSVHEKAVPVETDQPISRFGVAKVKTPISYKLGPDAATIGTGLKLKTLAPNKDFFAPAQFFKMDDGKKLSAPGFEQRQSGYVFAENPDNVRAGSTGTATLDYTSFIMTADGSLTKMPDKAPISNAVAAGLSRRSSVALGGANQAGTRKFIDRLVTQAFEVRAPVFVLSSTTALTAIDGGPAATTRSEALLALDAFRIENPEQRLQVQVSALHETGGMNHG